MGKRNLPDVSVKFIADVETMLANLKRAEKATQNTTSAMGKEVDKLSKTFANKFKLADFGKDVMKGAGIFGGMDIARTATEAIAYLWKDSAESAKAIQESSEKTLQATLKTIAARSTDAQKEAQLRIDYDRARKAWEEAKRPPMVTVPIWDGLRRVGTRTVPRTGGENENEAKNRAALADRVSELGAKIEELDRTKRDAAAETKIKVADDRRSRALKDQEAWEKTLGRINDELEKNAAEVKAQKDSLIELGDPLKNYRDQLEKIALYEKELTPDQAWAARVKVWGDMAEAINKAKPGPDYASMKEIPADQVREADEAMHKIGANAEEIERIVGRAADGMADAWVDALRGVEGAWSNLGDSIINEILRITAQILIVKPMINSLGGAFTSFGWSTLGSAFSAYGTPKASGGGVDAGFTYRVNEDGQEYFRPDVSGTIIPVGASGGMRGAGESVVVNQHYNIGAGVTAAQLIPILAMQKREIIASIADAKRRRTSLGTALA